MSPTQPLPSKKEVGLTLLERSSVYVHLDPREDAVVVPAWLKKQPQLVLQVGMNMPVPIPDLRFDDHGMSCTLSFSRAQFFCVVPWASVFAMVGEDGRGMVWPDDVPAEVAKQARTRATEGATPGKDGPKAATSALREARDGKPEMQSKAKRPRKRPALAAVPDSDSPSAPAGAAGSSAGSGNSASSSNAAGSSASGSSSSNNATKLPVAARNAPAPVRPIGTPSQASRPVAGPPRRKRELPPYLRVVK